MQQRLLKSNRGSSLVMVMLIITIMTTVGMAIMLLTWSEFRMSLLSSDRNKAYYIAEAGVERVAKALDDKVAEIQEAAREAVSDYIMKKIQARSEDRNADENGDGENWFNKDGSLNNAYVQKRFNELYMASDPDTENGEPESFVFLLKKAFLQTDDINQLLTGEDLTVKDDTGMKVIGSFQWKLKEFTEETNNNNGEPAYMATVEVAGTYGGHYKKTLTVKFNLLPVTSQTPYQVMEKAVVKNPVIPPLLTKAVAAEKNIVSAGGTVSIGGDVTCFGTLPLKDGSEDMDAPMSMYGGIVAGIKREAITYTNEAGSTVTTSQKECLGINNDSVPAGSAGSFVIDGSASTMGYVQTMYGDDESGKHSDITVNRETFARSVRADDESYSSSISLKGDVYTTDNVQIDSSNSEVTVGSDSRPANYYGFVDAGYETLDYDEKSEWQEKRTSSIVVNGNSKLNLYGPVYIGGSTFLTDYRKDAAGPDDPEAGHPYMTGLAAAKSGKNVAYAFTEYKKGSTTGKNNLYYYDSSTSYPYISSTNSDIIYNSYSGINMIVGTLTQKFGMQQRGVHVKGIWNQWKTEWEQNSQSEGFVDNMSNITTDNIRILGTGVYDENRLIGYSNGAIAANGKVYGPYDVVYKDIKDNSLKRYAPDEWKAIKDDCMVRYFNAVKGLIPPKDSYETFYENVKAESMEDSLMNTDTGAPDSAFSEINAPADSPAGRYFFFHSTGDVTIKYSGGTWEINGMPFPASCKDTYGYYYGLIYTGGNIYVDSTNAPPGGFKLKGSLLASGNVVFIGDAYIGYSEDVVKNLITNSATADFFKDTTYITPAYASGDKLQSQRVQVRNIQVADWKETK
ncbi:MAG: pilus assembly PilX N-terminal domain-containing protein [Clostridiales bacterium]|jgi:hypothetical protein|nr:pilus assembly PilX N-terminal domain-containing protein [Eubacteriales bacterium]MDH7565250.1 pilus assembly PilX N-terminal domain-containing protein [Clostridiales bacterium]